MEPLGKVWNRRLQPTGTRREQARFVEMTVETHVETTRARHRKTV